MEIKKNSNTLKSLNPLTVPLQQTNLIEASAGTGKTYTISLLYLRFVLESEPALSVEQILVVTYTTAATKELKDRIRLRLSEALEAFKSGNPKGDEYIKLCASFKDHKKAISRLSAALLSFDEASIFTIHSFCQRALKETAFDAGLAFETELIDDDYDLMLSLVDDYWRKNFHQAPDALLALLRDKEISPETLLNDIRIAVGKPYLKCLKPATTIDIAQQAEDVEQKYQSALKSWQESESEIKTLLREHKGFYANVVKSLDTMIIGMQTLALRPAHKSPDKLPAKVEALTPAKLRVKKNFGPIDHPFFEQWQAFLEARQILKQALIDYHNHLRYQLLDYLWQQLPIEKRRQGIMAFDDLLLQLQSALANNTALVNLLSEKYQVAMIDEFQDTDPVQYDIFQRIYGNNQSSIVFFVGDPKQAIYSFRGADIYTYLKAANDTKNQYTLDTNWRSHPDLIKALNLLFSYSDNPFYDSSIAYQKVKIGQKKEPSLSTPDARAPLRLWEIVETEGKKKSEIMTDIADLVADDITRLLIAGDNKKAKLGEKALEGGDIAVLIRSHSQGQQIKTALTERGIACVQSSKESIFQTHEASELHSLLLAIAQPSKEDQVRRALVSDFFGYNAEDLLHFDQDSNAWDSKLQAFQNWHQIWLTQGFIPMMRHLMRDEQIQAQLLSFHDGERRLTNLLHLSELIHSESRENSRGIEGTIRWLQQQSRQATLSSDNLQLRLESDDKLVKIVTVHKSKGLEYGLVYCPYLWADSIKSATSDASIMFHNDDKAHTPCLDIGSPKRDQHLELLEQEAYAENMRLLYVALTRAKYHCTVVTLSEKINRYIDRSALGWLLSNGEKAKSKNFLIYYQQNIEALVDASKGVIEALPLPEKEEGLYYQFKQNSQKLKARQFSTIIEQQHRITSFSGLTSGNHSQTHDHDADELFNQYTTPEPNNAINEFPRGANAGSCLHQIYENSDFTTFSKLQLEDNEQQQTEIIHTLERWGFTAELANTAKTLINTSLQAPLLPLTDNFSLSQLKNSQRLNEMEFHLPLSLLKEQELKRILLSHLAKEKGQIISDAIKKLSFQQVKGYLKGYIDLIFEHQGRYYIADYKSNTLENYETNKLLEAIAHSHYYLQYLLYSIALHRYLKQRLKKYQYKTHFGGIYYLFIRGMSKENQGTGIFYDLPPIELIENLDQLFS